MEIDIDGLLNLPNREVLDSSFSEKRVTIILKCVTASGFCPVCGIETKRVRCYTSRVVRDLAILGRKTYLQIENRQFECQDCVRYFTEDIEILHGNHGLTTRYEAHLYEQRAQSRTQRISRG